MRANPRRSAVLIFASHFTNWVILAMILSAAGYAFFCGGPSTFAWGLWPLLGLGLFMLNEYSMHRNILHMPVPDPERHPFLFKRYYRLHYGHHENPADVSLLFAPLWFTVPISTINFGVVALLLSLVPGVAAPDRKSTRLNSSHLGISYAVFCLKKKN